VTHDLLKELNPQQRQAVLHGEGPLLVFAGAGSGKTRVITHRIAHLVKARGVKPWNILAVTFTNKAAGEMRARVSALLGEGLRDTWIGTFHATCARLLRRYASEASLRSDFVIYDDGDQKAMVVRCLRDLNIDERRFAPRAIQGRINQAKQECVAADQYVPGNYFEDQVAKVYSLYEERMAAASALDFGDLLFRMVVLIERESSIKAALQDRFQYILVDEFQDTNYVQYRLLKLLTGPSRNLCVVGDDDQSIYRWRGADVRNILGFRKDFPDALVVTLEQNYRSTGTILASAVAVIKRNRTRAPKTLWTENADGEALQLVTLTDEREEAAFVVRSIGAEIDNGRALGDVAVFYRINAQARVIEEALRAANVRYRVIGGMKFYERAEIKDLIAYLRVIHNPMDDIDLVRIINTPSRKIGATTVSRLQAEASRSGRSLFETIDVVTKDGAWPAATRSRLSAFAELISDLRDLASASGPAELAVTVLERTKILEHLQGQDTPEAEARLENLKELVGSFELFEKEAEDPSLPALLETISLVQDVDSLDEAPDMVTLMTVHSAKGLEFPLVFLTGMEEDIFPYRRANDEVDDVERQEQLEEERRLCYVAFTRARQRLVLTNTVRRRLFGTERYNMPSRFVDDVPTDLIEVMGWEGGPSPSGGQARARASSRWPGSGPEVTEYIWESGTMREVSAGRGREGEAASDEPRVVLDEPVPDVVDDVQPGVEIRSGMNVRHKKFGVGRVHRVELGFEPKVTVDFPGHGRKTIMARFLEPY